MKPQEDEWEILPPDDEWEILPADVDFDAEKMRQNLWPSAKRFGANIYGAVTSPVETGKALIGLGRSGLAHIDQSVFGMEQPEELLAPGTAFANDLKSRYWGNDNWKRTLMEDPVGFAADVASVLAPVGGTAIGAGKLAAKGPAIVRKAAPVLNSAGEAIQTVGRALDPVNVVGKGIRGAVQLPARMVDITGEGLYQSGMKFKDLEVMREALARGVTPDKLGISKVTAEKARQWGIVEDALRGGEQRKLTAPAGRLFSGVEKAYESLPDPSISAGAQQAGFSDYMRRMQKHTGYMPDQWTPELAEILDTPKAIPPQVPSMWQELGMSPKSPPAPLGYEPGSNPNIPIGKVQELKQEGWKVLYNKKGEPVLPDLKPGSTRGMKAAQAVVSHNAKDILNEALGANYQAANKEWGTLKNISDELGPIQHRIESMDPLRGVRAVPLGIGGSVGHAVGGPTGGVLGMIGAHTVDTALSPTRRAKMGLGIHQFVNTPLGDYLTTGRSATGTGLSALMADLEREKQEKLGKAIRGY